MKVRTGLRSAIYQAARRLVGGPSPLFEVGYRLRSPNDYACTANANLWHEDADLTYMLPLRAIAWLEFDVNDRCALDLYAYTGTGAARGLETNITVWLVKEGEKVRVIGAWEFGQAPDYNRTDDEVEGAWQRLENQPVERIKTP